MDKRRNDYASVSRVAPYSYSAMGVCRSSFTISNTRNRRCRKQRLAFSLPTHRINYLPMIATPSAKSCTRSEASS